MSKRSSQKRRSLLTTLIGALVVVITAIIGLLNPELLEDLTVDQPADTPVFGTPVAANPGVVTVLNVGQGFGVQKDFWQVYFTAPTGSRDESTYINGIDSALINAINLAEQRLDIAAFEWNNPRLTQAVIAAHERGVEVRMVVDDEHVLEDEDTTIQAIIDAGIDVVDDDRSGLMHNKFMIIDGSTVWTGSMNFTMNGTYRNNNNLLSLRSRRAVEVYQIEFDEMFAAGEFGSSRSQNNSATFSQDGTQVQVVFSPEDNVVPNMVQLLEQAENNIRFMTFSFTLDEVGEALLEQADEGVIVEGIFEVRGSETEYSEMPRLLCAGLDVRQDGNPFTLHHKVFIIDDDLVLTGSFNISVNATDRNDENMVIISDPDLAAQYIAEFERVQSQATVPTDIPCS